MILGKVALTFGGDYSSSREYEKLVCVTYNGASYVSIREVPEGILPTNIQYWQVISSRGAQGPQGIPGPQGNSAFDGEGIEIVNNLVDGGEVAVLSAEQGKLLNMKLAQLDQDWNALKEQIQDAVLKVEVAPHIEVVTIEGGAAILQPDKLYDFGEVSQLLVGFEPPLEGKAANYAFQFKSPASAPTSVTMPDSVVFPVESDSMFNVKAGRTYQVTILNGLAVATSWEV